MSTRKLIKGDRYRAGLWKLEDSCYEGHVRMPNAKFMIRTYRCTQGEAVAKFDSWVEAEGLDLAGFPVGRFHELVDAHRPALRPRTQRHAA